LKPKFSKYLTSLLCLLHVCAAGAVFNTGLPVAGKATVLFLLMLSFAYQCYRQYYPIISKCKITPTCCHIQDRRQGWLEVDVQASTYVTPWLVILNLRERSCRRRRCMVLPADGLSRDEHRRLRARF